MIIFSSFTRGFYIGKVQILGRKIFNLLSLLSVVLQLNCMFVKVYVVCVYVCVCMYVCVFIGQRLTSVWIHRFHYLYFRTQVFH